ncbi:magnesium transporter [Tautonia plasticadhaerens]|uniref:Magnesium transporter MgtE n=1 Tax=Tautonia plasticadhaerens TaxID=2527974 RepID=A0A518HBZ1_9BACT|nr:magnesium transporter [Tautonia plasticadhaerens]QDV38372.1 Magnesium transporter MgtE [Tautonia plasticadhaerens]
MRNALLLPDLRELISDGHAAAVREFLEDYPPARQAELIEDLPAGEAEAVLRLLEPRARAEIVSYLDLDHQLELVEKMTPVDAAALLRDMPHDDRADLVGRLDADRAELILRRMAQAERDDIRRLTEYEAGTAGSVMTTDYATVPPFVSVREAIDHLRKEAPDRETILTSFVVDHQRRLIGTISLQALILARPTARVEDVMQADPIRAHVEDDREEVARKIAQYDLLALPIVDPSEMLVGIVTHDDALDILREEQSEDLLRFGAVDYDAAEADDDPGEEGIMTAVKRRFGWLLLLFGGGAITGVVVNTFGGVSARYPGIKFETFIPLLIGTGGNAGSQTVGTVIRGLALGDVDPRRDFARVIAREALTGLCLGLVLGPLGFVFTWLVMGGTPAFSLVIALAILGICVWANGVGSMVPMVARLVKIDPAVVSAPLISTLVDATGLMIFYTVARLIHRYLLT